MNRREVWGGITTFLTMSYIIVVNPAILSTPGTGISHSGALTATVLLASTMSLLMGLYANLPFAVAPGMGLNAFFTFSIILGDHVPWTIALGIVAWAGILFLLISATKLRVILAESIPHNLRVASAVGIGIFLSFIGLKSAGLVVADPATFVKAGPLTWNTGMVLLGMGISIPLLRRKSPLAFIAGIIGVTLVSALAGNVTAPTGNSWVSWPDFHSAFFHADLVGAAKLALLPSIISILFTDLFDSLSTFMGVAYANDLLDENGNPRNLAKGLLVDAFATFFAGLFGTSSGTAYLESSAGIQVGARTGMASVVTAICFLPFFFVGPLVQMIPTVATSHVLILIGVMMFSVVGSLDLRSLEESVPAFLTIILIPLTFSITQGILWGFVTQGVLYVLCGKWRNLKPGFVVTCFISMALLSIDLWK